MACFRGPADCGTCTCHDPNCSCNLTDPCSSPEEKTSPRRRQKGSSSTRQPRSSRRKSRSKPTRKQYSDSDSSDDSDASEDSDGHEDCSAAMGKALLRAAAIGKFCDVEDLLATGADANFTQSGWTPLHQAASGGHAAVVELLLQHGAEADAVTASGFTALHAAVSSDLSGECVKLLIAAGADVNAANAMGWTPLHYAAEGGNAVAVVLLMKAGACMSVRNNHGRTAFDLAKNFVVRDVLAPYCIRN